MNSTHLETLCQQKGLRMTDQRRIIVRVLSESQRSSDVDASISVRVILIQRLVWQTVYRTLRLLEEVNIFKST